MELDDTVPMTAPRMVVPGVSLLTRKTIQGQFHLHPYAGGRFGRTGKRLRNQCGYLLGYYAKKHGIDVGAANYYSNHPHLVLADRNCTLPEFKRDHNGLLARYAQFVHDSKGAVWEPDTGSCVELTSDEAILDAIAYTIMQQVKDGVLDKVHHWDGLVTRADTLFEPQTFYKDEAFWRTEEQGGSMPDSVVLQVKPMPGLDEELGAHYQQAVFDRCQEIAEKRRGKPVLGRRAVRKISWRHIPDKPKRVRKRTIVKAPDGTESAESPKEIRPRFTFRTRTAFLERAGRHKRFVRDYRKRRVSWLAGDTTSPWPYGTYAMCRRLGAPQAVPD